MSLKGFSKQPVMVPRGSWESLYNRRTGTPSRASDMLNMRIRFGTARSRPGTTAVLSTVGKVTGIFNWITPSNQNLVLFQDANTIKSYNQQTAIATTLLTAVPNRTPSFAPLDVWTYFCGYDTDGSANLQARIFDGVNVDKAFRAPPVLTGFTAVDGGPGQCTQGTHSIGFVYQTRNGYSGVPVTTFAGSPMQFKTAAGLRQINITATLPALSDGGLSANGGIQATLFLVGTRADNPAIWYFLPTDAQTGQIGEQPVPLNTPTTLNFVFSLSDEDIASQLAGDTAQKNFFFLTVGGDGTGPFNPNFVVAYGQRMCYGAGTTMYVSDINNPQQIANDTNEVRMQNQRTIGAAFQLPGSPNLFVSGDRWTGYVTDNSDSPSTWGQPVGVSDTLGAQFPDCICGATGGNYVWIATSSGVYYFDGTYTSNQLLYLVTGYDEFHKPTGWNRVNWNAAYAIQIKDDVANLKLYVAVPLDGAFEPNFMFVIDYRMGKTFETVDIGIDKYTPQQFSAIGVVKEFATGRTNLWIGPEAAGSIRHFDPATVNDLGAAIQCIWQSGLVHSGLGMIRVGYLDIWVRGHAPLAADGSSTLGLAIISEDFQFVSTPDLQNLMGVPAALVERPGIQYSAKLDLSKIYNYTVAFQTNAVDSWMEISGFTAYYKEDLSNR